MNPTPHRPHYTTNHGCMHISITTFMIFVALKDQQQEGFEYKQVNRRIRNKYFKLKNSWGAPNSNYLLAIGWLRTFVMPFSITLNASHAHIKQTHTCIHRHTQTRTDTPTYIIQTQTYTCTHTHHTDTHTTCAVCVCVYVCAHGNPQTYT